LRQLDQRAVDLIKEFEGLHRYDRKDGLIHPYHDVVGYPTQGYGHLLSKEKWADLSQWPPITKDKAEENLVEDLAETIRAVEDTVADLVELSDLQFGALVSWTFNLGSGSLRRSTMIKRVKAGLHAEVPEQIRRWNRAGGKVVSGLVRRRQAEAQMYIDGSLKEFQPDTGNLG
jgi:lysozyme